MKFWDMCLVSEPIKLQWVLLTQGHSLPHGRTNSLSNSEPNANKKWMKLFAKTDVSHQYPHPEHFILVVFSLITANTSRCVCVFSFTLESKF